MELKSLECFSQRLEAAASQVSHSGTTGGARVQLQLVQELEAALTSAAVDAAALKEASHGLMTSLLRMLENGLPSPVRTSLSLLLRVKAVYCCTHVYEFATADSSFCAEVFTRYLLRGSNSGDTCSRPGQRVPTGASQGVHTGRKHSGCRDVGSAGSACLHVRSPFENIHQRLDHKHVHLTLILLHFEFSCALC